ncbi:MAG TPA: carboxypeptidase-like regulatory domain-containing protein [Bryobacteraceae bacterium]|nr:carboxypeptidase-like regulatory domain-containing protein [Bryobacteraceae bacterium]
MTIPNISSIAIGFGCVLLCSCAGLKQHTGQDSTIREVEGIVTNSSGAPVEKAIVQLKDTKSLQIQSFITDAAGHYHFAGLSTDIEYQLKADHNGMTSGWKTLSLFNTKKVATINLKLKRRTG